MLPYMSRGEEEKKKKWSDMFGLKGAFMAFLLILVPVSAWFWLRMASVGEADFVATPSGTSFFLFAHVKGGDLEIASRFIAFLSIWISSTPVLLFIIYSIERTGLKKLAAVLLLLTSAGFFNAFLLIYAVIFGYFLRNVGSIILLSIGRSEDWANFLINMNETELGYW
jgi:hypothetical protein